MKTEEIIEIEKRWLSGWGVNLASWGDAAPNYLSDEGQFLTHDVPAMIAALKHNADKPIT